MKFEEEKISQKKIDIFLVSPIEEISLWLELSSPARFRIQGGSTNLTDKRTKEILMSNKG